MKKPLKSQALNRLKKALAEIAELKKMPNGSTEFKKWHRNTEVAIENTFGELSRHVRDFSKIHYILRISHTKTPASAYQNAYVKGLESASSVLQSMIEEVQEYWDNEEQEHFVSNKININTKNRNVFIVHGHDEVAKTNVARFIEKLDLKAIILHEQPNKGQTIIEKFESNAANVGFAVILLTSDDVGASKDSPKNVKARARQNVILELGYFCSALGRNRVCVLYKEDVEIPSDYLGVVYTPLDSANGWHLKLAKEIKEAGLDIDLNKAM